MSFPSSSASKESACNAGDPGLIPGLGSSPGEGIGYMCTPVFLGFPGGSDSKESAWNVGDLGLISGLGRSPGGGHGNPLQYSSLKAPSGQRSLEGHCPGDCKELDTTEWLSIHTAEQILPKIHLPMKAMEKNGKNRKNHHFKNSEN